MRNNLRMVVGLAISNPQVVNSCFTACHSLQGFGGLLTEAQEQEEAVGFLISFRERTGWRTEHVIEKLRSQWTPSGSASGEVPFPGLLD